MTPVLQLPRLRMVQARTSSRPDAADGARAQLSPLSAAPVWSTRDGSAIAAAPALAGAVLHEEVPTGQIKLSVPVDAPVGKATEIDVDPTRWASWRVNLGEVENVDGDGGPGTVVEHRYLMAGVARRSASSPIG